MTTFLVKAAEASVRDSPSRELADAYPEDAEARIFAALAELTTAAPNDFDALLAAAEKLEVLLELDRPRQALEAFQRSLEDSPGRFQSLYGAGRAAELSGAEEEAASFHSSLAEMVAAGSDRPAVKAARAFLGRPAGSAG